MKIIYNFMLGLLHVMGTILIAGISAARFIWYVDWSFGEELLFWICPLIVISAHYALIYVGKRKKLLVDKVLVGLKIWEIILYGAQLLILAFFFLLYLLGLSYLSIGQCVPILLLNLLIMAIRKISIEKN